MTRWARINPAVDAGPWTAAEDAQLLQLVQEQGTRSKRDWELIAERMHKRSAKRVKERYISAVDPSILRTPWTQVSSCLQAGSVHTVLVAHCHQLTCKLVLLLLMKLRSTSTAAC
jgi:Myb-like DNA-binding domain